MPFIKLDCGFLDSTLWFDRDGRDVFVTALLMAEPREFTRSAPEVSVDDTTHTGWAAPPGWYGFVPAAGTGIVRRAGIDQEAGYAALRRLAAPDPESRTPDYEGRRMIRIDGGFLILNYNRFRERDYTAAERSARYREKKRNAQESDDSHAVASRDHAVVSRRVTQAEAEEYKEPPLPSTGDPPTGGNPPRARKKTGPFVPPTEDEVRAYAGEVGARLTDPTEFHAYWTEEDWKNSKGRKIRDWRKTFRSRERDLEHRPVGRPRFGWEINPDVRVGKSSPDESEDDGTIELETEEEATFARAETLKGRPREEIRQEILARR